MKQKKIKIDFDTAKSFAIILFVIAPLFYLSGCITTKALELAGRRASPENRDFWKIQSVVSAAKKENGDISVCVELKTPNEAERHKLNTITLPHATLTGETASIDKLWYPIESKDGCEETTSVNISSKSLIPIKKLKVHDEDRDKLYDLLESHDKYQQITEQIYEVSFIFDEEKAEKETNDRVVSNVSSFSGFNTDDEMAKHYAIGDGQNAISDKESVELIEKQEKITTDRSLIYWSSQVYQRNGQLITIDGAYEDKSTSLFYCLIPFSLVVDAFIVGFAAYTSPVWLPFAAPGLMDGAYGGVPTSATQFYKSHDSGEKPYSVQEAALSPATVSSPVKFDTAEPWSGRRDQVANDVDYDCGDQIEAQGYVVSKKVQPEKAIVTPATVSSSVVVDPNKPWSGEWFVKGHSYYSGRWYLIQTGRIVSSTKDNYLTIKGKARENHLKGKIKVDVGSHHPFDLTLSSDGLSFKGTVGTRGVLITGKKQTVATLFIPKIDPAEPWTGKWKVDGGEMSGIYVMKQSGKIVKSTKDSNFKFKGKVEGNQLNGRLWWSNKISPPLFVMNMSSDGMSFEGNMSALSNRYDLRGKRIE